MTISLDTKIEMALAAQFADAMERVAVNLGTTVPRVRMVWESQQRQYVQDGITSACRFKSHPCPIDLG